MEVTIIPVSISVVNKEVEREQQYYYCPGGQRTIHRQGRGQFHYQSRPKIHLSHQGNSRPAESAVSSQEVQMHKERSNHSNSWGLDVFYLL